MRAGDVGHRRLPVIGIGVVIRVGIGNRIVDAAIAEVGAMSVDRLRLGDRNQVDPIGRRLSEPCPQIVES